MKVLYYGIKENNGGLENFAKNLITSVVEQKRDIEYVLLVTSKDFSYRYLFESLGCEIIFLPNPRKHPLKYYQSLKKTLLKYKESVVHLNICSFRNYFLFHACKKMKLKTIIVGHFSKIEGNLGFLHYINRKFYSNFALNVTINDEVTKFMFSKGTKPLFIDNGVPSEKFSFNELSRKVIRDKYKVPSDCYLIGQVGRLSSEKNQLFAIKSFECLKVKYQIKAKLILVGKVMDDASIKYAKNSKYNQDIIFVGSVSDGIEMYYSAFDVCIIPSKHEGSPLCLLECASNGVNTIVSSSVPRLKIRCNQLYYNELVVSEWADKLYVLSTVTPNKRINCLSGTAYDMDVCAESYIRLYLNYDSIKDSNCNFKE